MQKLNLFGKSKVAKFSAIGDKAIGMIHLLKRGVIVAKENPTDLQQADRRMAKIIVLREEATKRLAKAKGIDTKEAAKLLSDQDVNGVRVLAPEKLDDWLTEQEREQFYEHALSSNARKKAVTLMIRHRLAYPVIVAENVSAKEGSITVEPLRFPLAIGDVLRFPAFRVEVIEPAEIEDERVYVRPLPQSLNAEDVGFLLDRETGKDKTGCLDSKTPSLSLDHAREFATFLSQRGYSSVEAQKIVTLLLSWLEDQSGWTMSHTDELEEAQIDAIYQFYQTELGAIVAESDEDSEMEGNAPPELSPSENSQPVLSLTTSNTTPEFSPTESPIPPSTPTTSESAP